MDCVLKKGRVYQDRKILLQYKNEIENLRMKLIEKEELVNKNNKIIEENKDKIEVLLANDSMVFIEHMREVEGRY